MWSITYAVLCLVVLYSSKQTSGQDLTATTAASNFTEAVVPNIEVYVDENEDKFCVFNKKRPFYQRYSDGAICCRGKILPIITVIPETSGECAISTKTDENGILNSPRLWCAYSCTLKKMGLVDEANNVVPDKFFNHLTQGLTPSSKSKLKIIMETYLQCFKPIKNPNYPCYSALGFHRCYKDALMYLCNNGMPKNNDFSALKKPVINYVDLKPYCYYNKRRVMPGCCHGRPLPWTITEIMEAPRNDTKMKICMRNMGEECDATCFLHSIGVVSESMELDADKFSSKVLQLFPALQPSSWMYFTGPTFLFYDEMITDMYGDQLSSDPSQRICMFHDQIMELHEAKVEQYCQMKPDEVKDIYNSNSANTSKTV